MDFMGNRFVRARPVYEYRRHEFKPAAFDNGYRNVLPAKNDRCNFRPDAEKNDVSYACNFYVYVLDFPVRACPLLAYKQRMLDDFAILYYEKNDKVRFGKIHA